MKELAKYSMHSILLGEERRCIKEETMSERREEGRVGTHTKGFLRDSGSGGRVRCSLVPIYL